MADHATPDASQRACVLAVVGEIDLAVAPMLREALGDLVSAGRHDIYVDLIDATFIDSIALGVLVGARDACREAGGELHLVVSEPRIMRVLEITGLVKTFDIRESREALPADYLAGARVVSKRETQP